jgi:hypothetical protein
MFIDRDWLAKQEAINEQLRRRAEARLSVDSRTQRSAAVRTQAQASNGLVRRSLAAAGRVLTAGG